MNDNNNDNSQENENNPKFTLNVKIPSNLQNLSFDPQAMMNSNHIQSISTNDDDGLKILEKNKYQQLLLQYL